MCPLQGHVYRIYGRQHGVFLAEYAVPKGGSTVRLLPCDDGPHCVTFCLNDDCCQANAGPDEL